MKKTAFLTRDKSAPAGTNQHRSEKPALKNSLEVSGNIFQKFEKKIKERPETVLEKQPVL